MHSQYLFTPTKSVFRSLVNIYLHRNDFEKAVDVLERARGKSQADLSFYNKILLKYVELGNWIPLWNTLNKCKWKEWEQILWPTTLCCVFLLLSEMNSLSKVDDLLSQMERSNIEWDNATFLTLLSYYQSLYHTDDGKARMWGLCQ